MFAIALALCVCAQSGIASSYGYASYRLTYTSYGSTHVVLLNESLSPTSNPNLSLLTVTAQGSGWNLTYSVAVNSTLNPFPYLPPITNRSITYEAAGLVFEFNISDLGAATIVFGGQTYRGELYAFQGELAVNETAYSVAGNITVFATRLIYSLEAKLGSDGFFELSLVSTNLPLEGSDSHPAYSVAVMAGAGAAAIALFGLGLPFLYRRSKRTRLAQRRDYWVD